MKIKCSIVFLSLLITLKATAQNKNMPYPFNKAATIAIVSFNNFNTDCNCSIFNNYVVVPDSIFLQQKVLKKKEIAPLIKLLSQSHKEAALQTPNCFKPKHAIVFKDSSAKIFDYIEISFACKELAKSNTAIPFNEEKFTLSNWVNLKNFFLKRKFSIL
jgi:hypothetical protein